MNVLYDSEGYEYPVDDYGQIYISLKTEQTAAGTHEEEEIKKQKTKKILCQCGRCWCHMLLSWYKIIKRNKKLEGSCEAPP